MLVEVAASHDAGKNSAGCSRSRSGALSRRPVRAGPLGAGVGKLMQFAPIHDCWICGGPLQTVFELPDLPLTGIYSRTGQDKDFPTLDQALMLCPRCEHGQALNVISPDSLYGEQYQFTTSGSETSTRGAAFFVRYLESLAPGARFARVFEFGCSDAVLLRLLRDRSGRLVGADPILKGREGEFNDDKVTVIGDRVENIDLGAALAGAPDLIVCRHTLEHVGNPRALLRQVLDVATEDTLFVFEFPCFDPLLERYRFDHVFHQHAQYFSVKSICKFLRSMDAEPIDFTFNYDLWGAILIAFRKAQGARRQFEPAANRRFPEKTLDAIQRRYNIFLQQMDATRQVLAGIDPGKLYGYGAALMLPLLGYYLKTDFAEFQSILDDDPAKDGLGYINLPVKVRNPRDIDFSEAAICLTAMDNRRPILRRLAERNPRQIINPLCVL